MQELSLSGSTEKTPSATDLEGSLVYSAREIWVVQTGWTLNYMELQGGAVKSKEKGVPREQRAQGTGGGMVFWCVLGQFTPSAGKHHEQINIHLL